MSPFESKEVITSHYAQVVRIFETKLITKKANITTKISTGLIC